MDVLFIGVNFILANVFARMDSTDLPGSLHALLRFVSHGSAICAGSFSKLGYRFVGPHDEPFLVPIGHVVLLLFVLFNSLMKQHGLVVILLVHVPRCVLDEVRHVLQVHISFLG
jgi:hypothetical protein